MIAYASMYGNTEAAAQALASRLCERGCTNVWMYDVSNTHISQLISESFRLSHIVLASVTYNLGIYPVMHNYLMDMKALNLQNRTFASSKWFLGLQVRRFDAEIHQRGVKKYDGSERAFIFSFLPSA
mgnify:CR=1 FL=1